MAAIGPYRVLRRLGVCPAGPVWWGVDDAGNYVSIAVLDPVAAADQRWRAAFAAGAAELAPPQGVFIQIAQADFTGPAPWVACVADGGPGAAQVFVSLGMPYTADAAAPSVAEEATHKIDLRQVVSEPTTHLTTVRLAEPLQPRGVPPVSGGPVSGGPVPVSGVPVSGSPAGSVSGGPVGSVSGSPAGSVSGGPVGSVSGVPGGGPVLGGSVSGGPAGTSAGPVLGGPVAGSAAVGGSVAGDAGAVGRSGADQPPGSGAPPAGSSSLWSYNTLGGPGATAISAAYPPIGAVARPGNRRAWIIAIAVAATLVLAAVGTFVVVVLRGPDRPTATPVPSPGPTPTPSRPSPSQPGVEPTASASRPADWPGFPEAQDGTWKSQPIGNTGLTIKVPTAWTCTEAAPIGPGTRAVCQETTAGGDVIVRPCPQPCDGARQAELRRSEEAFGLPYVHIGPFASLAEEPTRYALVLVVYYRSVPYGAIDRQLVVRFTGPVDRTAELRRVANSAWDAAVG